MDEQKGKLNYEDDASARASLDGRVGKLIDRFRIEDDSWRQSIEDVLQAADQEQFESAMASLSAIDQVTVRELLATIVFSASLGVSGNERRMGGFVGQLIEEYSPTTKRLPLALPTKNSSRLPAYLVDKLGFDGPDDPSAMPVLEALRGVRATLLYVQQWARRRAPGLPTRDAIDMVDLLLDLLGDIG